MKLSLLTVGLSSLLLLGCSEPAPVAKKEPPKPAEAVSGASALFKMYQDARAKFSPDAKVLKMNSIHLAEVTSVPGKAGAWQATFTSENLGKARNYTYSVVEEEGNLHKGAFSSGEQSWTPGSGGSTPINIGDVTVDSEAAYKVALEKSADYDKKNPGMTISFVLERPTKYNEPVWRVIWGESAGTSNNSVYVSASSGKFLEKMH